MNDGSFHAQTAERIWPVEHDKFHARFAASFHGQAHRADERVGAAAGVLKIINQRVQALEHLSRWFASGAVKRMHRQTGPAIHAALDKVAGGHVAIDAMFRAEKGDEIDAFAMAQDFDGGLKLPVHAGGIGYQTHPFSAQCLEPTLRQYLISQFYFGRGRKGAARQRQGYPDSHGASFRDWAGQCKKIILRTPVRAVKLPNAGRSRKNPEMNRRNFLQKVAASASLTGMHCFPIIGAEADPSRKFILSAPLTHSDWMLKPGIKWGAEGVRHMLDMCHEAGWSRIYWRVLDGGRSLYRSRLLQPMGRWDADSFWSPVGDADKALAQRYTSSMTPAQREELLRKFDSFDYAHFDPFAEAIRYGHELGIQIHAWVSINEDDHGWGLQSEFSKKHPEYRWRGRTGRIYHSQLSFAFPEVRRYKMAILKELVGHYKLDGIFLDWIRTGDVRDNPQNDKSGVADYGYETPLVEGFKKAAGKNPQEVENGDDAWVKFRSTPQTLFMREVRKWLRKVPLTAMVGHPWHYRGEIDKIDGNLKGLLLDVAGWAREGLVDALVPAGYYRDGGDAVKACEALKKETGGRVDVWSFAWVPQNIPDLNETWAKAGKSDARQILFWEADYIDDRPDRAELKAAMKKRSSPG